MRKFHAYGPSVVVLITAVLVLVAGPQAIRRLTFHQSEAQIHQASERLRSNPILEELNQAYRDIALVVEPSVVHISAERLESSPWQPASISLSTGSGWVWDNEGHLVTNYHVVENAERIDVQLHDGSIHEAQVLGYDRFTDIAVLKIPGGSLHPARRAEMDIVQQGDMVFAFGSPFDFRFSMSSGVVSGLGRYVGVIRFGAQGGYENFIQVDAAINPGNSGGPLTNHRGEVIGMNTAIATRQGARDRIEEGQFAGIGLAIPLEMINPVVMQLIDSGVVTKGFLGVQAETFNDRARAAIAAQYERYTQRGFIGDGAIVLSIDANGPADRSGVLAGDVITAVNDIGINSMAQLRSVISSMLPGERATLTVWRPNGDLTGELLRLPVRLEELDVLRVGGTIPLNHSTEHLDEFGLAAISTCTQHRANELGVPFRRGVLVERLHTGTDADELIPAGSVITEVFGYSVTSVEDMFRVLRNDPLDGQLGLVIMTPDGVDKRVRLRLVQS